MNTRTRLTIVAAGAALACLTTFSTAHAGAQFFDLTGTWQGNIKCKSFFDGSKTSFPLTPTLKISQSGLKIGILADYPPGDIDDSYVGYANPDAKKPFEKGEFALIYCGTDDVLGNDPTFDEIGRMAAKTKAPKVKATFKGTSLYSDPGVTDAEAGTCKWTWTRIDDADPRIPLDCPPP